MSVRICAVFNAETNPAPSSLSAVACASVIIARSPTKITRSIPKRSLTVSSTPGSVLGSAMLPGCTWTDTGRPSGEHKSPQLTCSLPFLPSRL